MTPPTRPTPPAAQDMTGSRPDLIRKGGAQVPPAGAAREERLKTLRARWDQFASEYQRAREMDDEELMTNLRGLMLLIKREIRRLGGEAPEFPYPEEAHLADL